MSRLSLPFHAEDISALARSLKGQITACDHDPSHVELLNMLARSGGYRNFQHFRAQVAAQQHLASPPPVPEPTPVDFIKVRRMLRHFDAAGRLIVWPSKRSQQQLCLWVVWSRVPPRQVFSEPEINRVLTANHLFGDYALLRRWLCDDGMMTRTADGREYRRVEQRPPPDAVALIGHLSHGGAASSGS